MKTRTFGKTTYMVETYYTNEKRAFDVHYMRFVKAETANNFTKRFKRHTGESCYPWIKGKIIDSFCFVVKQCLFEE